MASLRDPHSGTALSQTFTEGGALGVEGESGFWVSGFGNRVSGFGNRVWGSEVEV